MMKRAAFYVFVVIVCAIAFFPFYWMINTSLIKDSDLFSYPPKFMPNQGLLGTYAHYLKSNPILTWLRNSALVSVAATALSTIFAILGSYSISRFKYKGKVVFIFLILLTQMMPMVLLVIPLYITFRIIHLNNSLVGLTLVYAVITVPIGLWFLKGFFDAIPIELEQAAAIDGCSRVGTLVRITLPLSVPGVIATATWSFIIAWDEFIFAYTFISTEKLWPVAVGLSSHIGQYSVNWSQIMAGAVMATLPIAILFVFFQRYLVSGITAGSVKG
jgi:ABC-type glycerol-3-phosphate transport system permease component